MSSAISAEKDRRKESEPIDLADRLAHFAFTGIWASNSRALRVSMSLSGIGQPGTNLMVNSFIPPELLSAEPEDLVK